MVQTEQIQQEYQVYMVYCKWTLQDIYEFLEDYEGKEKKDNFARVVHDRNGETDRSIVMITKETYQNLCAKGYGEKGKQFRIIPYRLGDRDFPKEEHSTNLFVPVPKSLTRDEKFVTQAITDKLDQITDFGILESGTWIVRAILQSREFGGVKGGCFIEFTKDVVLERIALTRVLMTDTFWPDYAEEEDEVREQFRCVWARKSKPHTEIKDKPAPKKIPQRK